MIRFATFLALCAVLGGCTSQLVTQKIGPSAAKAINEYCLQPQDARMALRQQVNSLVTPNSVQINCSGDAVK